MVGLTSGQYLTNLASKFYHANNMLNNLRVIKWSIFNQYQYTEVNSIRTNNMSNNRKFIKQTVFNQLTQVNCKLEHHVILVIFRNLLAISALNALIANRLRNTVVLI